MKPAAFRTLAFIGSATILMTSCVSSKKYKASQAEVARLQSDSSSLAKKNTELQSNLTSEQQKSADLQKNVATANTTNSGLTKNLAYYTDYAGQQQASTEQVKTDMASTLASAGITDQDFLVKDGKVYINIGEKSLFKGNGTALTQQGKELVENIGQYIKAHEAVDINVADLQMANAATTGNMTDANMPAPAEQSASSMDKSSSTASSNHYSGKSSHANANMNDQPSSAKATTDKTATKHVAVHHAKKPTTTASSETKATAYKSNSSNKYTAERSKRTAAKSVAWQRQKAVADALLESGVPKVKVVAQRPSATSGSSAPKGVQVVLVNNMDEFYKHMSEAPKTEPVSMNK